MRWILRGLAIILVIVAGLAAWRADDIRRLLAVNSLFAPDKIVANFSNMDDLFFYVPVDTGTGPAAPLPRGAALAPPPGFDAWQVSADVTGMVVLKDGAIVQESYHLGTSPEDLRISWSMAKSYLSLLFGILLDEGEVESLDYPVTHYVPELAGSAYDGASIRDVLQMSSGIAFNEDYFDFWSDINRMGRVLAIGGSMDAFAIGQDERLQPPGTAFQYVSIDTHVLGMVLRRATGRRLGELMSEKLMIPMGMEGEAYFVTDGDGVAFALGGLNLMTRDYARMGQMVLHDGAFNGRQIVPAEWIAESTVPSANTRPGALQYGYQWWMPADARPGEVMALGVYGQFIYINRPAGVVIAVNAADRQFRDPGVRDGAIDMFRRISEAAQ